MDHKVEQTRRRIGEVLQGSFAPRRKNGNLFHNLTLTSCYYIRDTRLSVSMWLLTEISFIVNGLRMPSMRPLLGNSVSFLSHMKVYSRKLLMSIDNWDRGSHPMVKNDFGVWEIVIPAIKGKPAIPHNSKVKVSYLHFIPSSLVGVSNRFLTPTRLR